MKEIEAILGKRGLLLFIVLVMAVLASIPVASVALLLRALANFC